MKVITVKGAGGSSVSIVADYGLDRGSIPDRGRRFSF
jgi:hypothetical protein